MSSEAVLTYGPAQPDEIQAVGELLAQALHFNMSTDEEVTGWLDRVGPDGFRLVRRNGLPVAGMRIIEMGQWFGGARIPIAGINAVGVVPEFRGTGIGAFLMEQMHTEAYHNGLPLATLFPATTAFYRSVGYERGGAWNTYELSTDAIYVRERSVEMVPAGGIGQEVFEDLYTRRARLNSGNLDRSPDIWRRANGPKDRKVYKYLIQGRDGPEGYVIYFQHKQHEPIQITDHCVLTAAAARRLLTFFADHRTLSNLVRWYSGPQDPLLFLLTEQNAKLVQALDWMVRIIDVERALRLRGYPSGLDAELHLDVHDDSLPWNGGRLRLHIEDGKAEVERGGKGQIRIEVRGLAALYTGNLSAFELRTVGLLEGPDEALATADLIFSGPRPWMPDIF